MPGRRGVLAAAAAAFVPPGPPVAGVPRMGALRLRLLREGSAIGTHMLLFHFAPGGFAIAIAMEIAVRIGPLVLYRYPLRGSETRRSGRCMAATSRTDDDGTAETMRATRDPTGLWVEGTGTPRYLPPADALVASHWNQQELRGPWINLQNGKLLHPRITPLGADPALTVDGARVPADCFAVTGPARMRLWYALAQI